MSNKRNYTAGEKAQILEEVKISGNVAAVARKNHIPSATIHTWLHKEKPKVKAAKQHNDEAKKMKRHLSELELKNRILTELLKKTYQLWPEN
jgi:transposase-like protein